MSLPKGGGAIRGIGEKFAANPVTGTGSMSVPIATSPGYKCNLSPINEHIEIEEGKEIRRTTARFARLQRVVVTLRAGLNGGAQFMDLAGDGQPDPSDSLLDAIFTDVHDDGTTSNNLDQPVNGPETVRDKLRSASYVPAAIFSIQRCGIVSQVMTVSYFCSAMVGTGSPVQSVTVSRRGGRRHGGR